MKREMAKADEFKSRIQYFFKDEQNVAAVFLFGSYGTIYENKFSDIDFGVVFMPDALIKLQEELSLEAKLSLYLKTDNIDLVNLNKAPITFRFQAIANGILLYEKDYVATSNFIENTYRYYFDYSHNLKIMRQERSKSLKEAYIDG